MNNKKNIFIIEIIIFIYIIIFRLIVMKYIPNYINIVNICFWGLLLLILILCGGFPRNKNYLKKDSLKTVIIVLLYYILIIYFSGLFLGFHKLFYSRNIVTFIKNILVTSSIILLTEAVRYLILGHKPSKFQIVILTAEFILFFLELELGLKNFANFRQLFVFSSTILFPLIAQEILLTYISYNIGLVPTLIYKLAVKNYIYFVPFLPNLSDYLTSVIGLIIPYIIYLQIHKSISYYEKKENKNMKLYNKVFIIIAFVFNIILISLISGIFKYQMIAIVSGSMEPTYYRGDAIIFKKETAENIKKGDILVFKTDVGLVTHRVIEIKVNNDSFIFKTKGDNNKDADNIKITENNVVGKVVSVVKYIGYPTIFFNELFD